MRWLNNKTTKKIWGTWTRNIGILERLKTQKKNYKNKKKIARKKRSQSRQKMLGKQEKYKLINSENNKQCEKKL